MFDGVFHSKIDKSNESHVLIAKSTEEDWVKVDKSRLWLRCGYIDEVIIVIRRIAVAGSTLMDGAWAEDGGDIDIF